MFQDSGEDLFHAYFLKRVPNNTRSPFSVSLSLNARPLFKWHVFSAETPIMSQQINKQHKRRLEDANLNKGEKFLVIYFPLFSGLGLDVVQLVEVPMDSLGFKLFRLLFTLVKRNPKSIQILRKDENWCQLCNNLWPNKKTKQSKTETASCDKRRR